MSAPAKRQPVGWMGPSQDHQGKWRIGDRRNGKWFVTDSEGRKIAGPFADNIGALRWLDSYELHRLSLLPPADRNEFHRLWINTKTAADQRGAAAAATIAAVPGTAPDRAARWREPVDVTQDRRRARRRI
jgi:hypothetical protein